MRRLPATILLAATALLGVGAVVAWAKRNREHPSACPYGQRVFLDLPRPFLRRQTLREMLIPVPGERVLEVGPGTGYYSLHVARWIAPGGQLDVLDLQESMLDELRRRATERGLDTIEATQGDARDLPFPDSTFDAAYLVATLGEIPDRDQALRELQRVLKPGGRLVVGEGQPDPHMLAIDDLRERADAVGLRFEMDDGTRFGYFARFCRG